MKAASLAAFLIFGLALPAVAAPGDPPQAPAVQAPSATAKQPARPRTRAPERVATHAHARAHGPAPHRHASTMVRRDTPVPARLKRKPVRKPAVTEQATEREGFKKVSSLVNFPAFYPGLGIIYVKPDTLPIGPFRTFDRKGKLIASVYMLPLKDLNDQKRWDYVKGLPAPADHATFYYHPGHPGVPMPHYHFVIWHVPRAQESLVAK